MQIHHTPSSAPLSAPSSTVGATPATGIPRPKTLTEQQSDFTAEGSPPPGLVGTTPPVIATDPAPSTEAPPTVTHILDTVPPLDASSSDVLVAASTDEHATKHLLISNIEELARARLVTVHVDDLLSKVAALLSSSQNSLVVVCDSEGVAVGVITETILVRQLGFAKADIFTTCAHDVMSQDFTVCRLSDSLPEILAQMHERGDIHVAIIDDNRYPLGILNARDGLRALLAQGHYEESLLRNYVMGMGYH